MSFKASFFRIDISNPLTYDEGIVLIHLYPHLYLRHVSVSIFFIVRSNICTKWNLKISFIIASLHSALDRCVWSNHIHNCHPAFEISHSFLLLLSRSILWQILSVVSYSSWSEMLRSSIPSSAVHFWQAESIAFLLIDQTCSSITCSFCDQRSQPIAAISVLYTVSLFLSLFYIFRTNYHCKRVFKTVKQYVKTYLEALLFTLSREYNICFPWFCSSSLNETGKVRKN